ncbi:MAG: ATP-binding cassette domain-containing protein [Betaproteobacteria bacterium]|nr:ATP-binding cassette domain-containing protein [Betaproteobacteria bacterium]MDE1954958.1 ATP-binding cassette domain-containing protein [Betaproteobacteria bacterium]MDE2152889.1 ATP-binding cassette domain-containing protein [Betaproteobacteria bacterium]
MIRLQGLSLRRGAKVVLDQAELTVQPGEKLGLVGANGAGKSSLFALLLGQLIEDGGTLEFPAHWRVASVAQQVPDEDCEAAEFVCRGDTALQEALRASREAEHDGDAQRIAAAAEALELAQAYSARARAEALLLGLGFGQQALRQPVRSFSGGWRMRLALAQALFQPSDCMLLDEPTNHLDLDALVWLESWLSRYPGTLLVISHDREFLDAATRVTVHLEQGRLSRYAGGYTAFEQRRAQALAQQAQAYTRQQADIARLNSFVERFRAKATKARQAQSRLKALERMQLLAPVVLSHPLQFEFLQPQRQPQQLLRARGLDCGFGPDKRVLRGVELDVLAGARIGVLGANGQGKSTLVKTLAGVLEPLGGSLHAGEGVVLGYFAQQEMDVLRPDETAMQHLQRQAQASERPGTTQDWRDWLGRFQFSGELAAQPVGTMSGGERARLLLALLVWQRPNVLLLDEPTNHLDLPTREALSFALQEFGGAMLLVSHDRALLRAVCDEYWLVADGGVRAFDGDLDDYQRWVLERAREAARAGAGRDVAQEPGREGAPEAGEGAQAAPENRREQRKASARQRAERDRALAPLRQAQAAAQGRLDRMEARRGQLEQALAAATPSPAERAEAGRELKQLLQDIEDCELEWLDLEQRMQGLQA